MTPIVCVEARGVYGQVKLYPVSPSATWLAALCKTTTLSPKDLAIAQKLGAVVEVDGNSVDEARTWASIKQQGEHLDKVFA